MMHPPPHSPSPDQADLVEAARLAIWRLFQEGYVDEDMATAGLLAIDLGMRRTQQSTLPPVQSSAHHVQDPPTHAPRKRRAA